ncbi:MAG: hypothetical protein ACKOKE_01420 [Actinomycetota bacterium]
MTEGLHRAARTRLGKGALRTWAWVSSGVAFLLPFGALSAAPKPAEPDAAPSPSVVVRRLVTHRVIVRRVVQPAPRIVYANGTTSSATATATATPSTTTTTKTKTGTTSGGTTSGGTTSGGTTSGGTTSGGTTSGGTTSGGTTSGGGGATTGGS